MHIGCMFLFPYNLDDCLYLYELISGIVFLCSHATVYVGHMVVWRCLPLSKMGRQSQTRS